MAMFPSREGINRVAIAAENEAAFPSSLSFDECFSGWPVQVETADVRELRTANMEAEQAVCEHVYWGHDDHCMRCRRHRSARPTLAEELRLVVPKGSTESVKR